MTNPIDDAKAIASKATAADFAALADECESLALHDHAVELLPPDALIVARALRIAAAGVLEALQLCNDRDDIMDDELGEVIAAALDKAASVA